MFPKRKLRARASEDKFSVVIHTHCWAVSGFNGVHLWLVR